MPQTPEVRLPGVIAHVNPVQTRRFAEPSHLMAYIAMRVMLDLGNRLLQRFLAGEDRQELTIADRGEGRLLARHAHRDQAAHLVDQTGRNLVIDATVEDP